MVLTLSHAIFHSGMGQILLQLEKTVRGYCSEMDYCQPESQLYIGVTSTLMVRHEYSKGTTIGMTKIRIKSFEYIKKSDT